MEPKKKSRDGRDLELQGRRSHFFGRVARVVAALALVLVVLGISADLAATYISNWVAHPPSHTPRTEGVAIIHDGKLYSLAGFARDVAATHVSEVYDPDSDSWELLAPIPRAVTHAGAALVDSRIWIVGGFEGNHPGPAVDIVQIYDIATNTWHMGPPLPVPRASGTLALLGRKLHYVSGLLPDRSTDVGDHYVLDVDHEEHGWTAAAPLPNPRNHLSSAVLEGRLYAIGGQFGHDGGRALKAYVDVYDFSTDKWSRRASLPLRRSHAEASTFSYNGRIYMLGGVGPGPNRTASLDLMTVYDPSSNSWTDAGTLPEKLLGPAAGVIGERLYAANGSIGLSGNAQADLWSTSVEPRRQDTLGFWPATSRLQLVTGHSGIIEALLWTHSGRVPFELDSASLPDWVTTVSTPPGVAGPSATSVAFIVDASDLEPGTYRAAIEATAVGYAKASLPIVLTVAANPAESFVEEGGPVVIDAENYQTKRAGRDRDWTAVSRYDSTGSILWAGPDQGGQWDDISDSDPARVGYRIRFNRTGMYYVWVRSWGPNLDADSWHIGLNGLPRESSSHMRVPNHQVWPPLWVWSNSRVGAGRASIEILTCGEHVMDLWMREDGIFIDRLLITTDEDYVPTAEGPPESRRTAEPGSCDSTSTTLEPNKDELRGFSLSQNFPNPYSTRTNIRFTLAQTSAIRLVVYDALGRLVSVLEDGTFSAGNYDRDFDATGLTSGLYIYELRAGASRQSRHMLISK